LYSLYRAGDGSITIFVSMPANNRRSGSTNPNSF
jgi:hypothetical protein